MPKVICTLPNASTSINGWRFEQTDEGMVSEDLAAEAVELLVSIPGYALFEDKDSERAALEARAAELGVQVKQGMSLPRLKLLIETAEKGK